MPSTFIVTEIPDRPGRSRIVAEADSLDELYAQVGAMRIAARRAPPVPRGSASPTILAMRRRVEEIARAEDLIPFVEPKVFDGMLIPE